MGRLKLSSAVILCIFSASSVWGAKGVIEAETERLQGFVPHREKNQQLDRERENGEQAYLEEQEIWDLQQKRALAEYKKNKKVSPPLDETSAEYKQDKKAKEQEALLLEKARIKYAQEQVDFDRSKLKGVVSEEEELDLFVDRPRYDYRKRATFGGKTALGLKSGSAGGGFGGSSSGPRFGGSDSPGADFPPPPVFDDFVEPPPVAPPEDGGFVPPPFDPTDDIPPPPPPPLPDDVGDF